MQQNNQESYDNLNKDRPASKQTAIDKIDHAALNIEDNEFTGAADTFKNELKKIFAHPNAEHLNVEHFTKLDPNHCSFQNFCQAFYEILEDGLPNHIDTSTLNNFFDLLDPFNFSKEKIKTLMQKPWFGTQKFLDALGERAIPKYLMDVLVNDTGDLQSTLTALEKFKIVDRSACRSMKDIRSINLDPLGDQENLLIALYHPKGVAYVCQKLQENHSDKATLRQESFKNCPKTLLYRELRLFVRFSLFQSDFRDRRSDLFNGGLAPTALFGTLAGAVFVVMGACFKEQAFFFLSILCFALTLGLFGFFLTNTWRLIPKHPDFEELEAFSNTANSPKAPASGL